MRVQWEVGRGEADAVCLSSFICRSLYGSLAAVPRSRVSSFSVSGSLLE